MRMFGVMERELFIVRFARGYALRFGGGAMPFAVAASDREATRFGSEHEAAAAIRAAGLRAGLMEIERVNAENAG